MFFGGSSSVVEHHLAKVGVAGSSPVFRSMMTAFLACVFVCEVFCNGPIAQLVRATGS